MTGVLDVLTHENRPRMAADDTAYKDDVAPEQGSPFRPLYDDKILFSGQPIALVRGRRVGDRPLRRVAGARRIQGAKPHRPICSPRRDTGRSCCRKRRTQAARQAPTRPIAAAPRCATTREYYIPIEHHNPMELYASTVVWEGDGKLTVYDKTQGVQNVQRYLCSVFGMKPDDVRVVSPFVGGGFGSGLRPQYQVAARRAGGARAEALGAAGADPPADVRARLPAGARIERLALGANADGTLDAISHEAIAVTSQYEDFYRNDTGWSGLLYKSAQRRTTRTSWRGSILPTPSRHARAGRGDRRLCARMRDGRARGRAQARSARTAPALLFRPRPARRPALHQQELRECYRQGADAFGWSKRNAGAALDARRQRAGRLGHGDRRLGSAADAESAVRIVLTANGHAEVACATSDIGTGTYTIMAQVAADMLGLPIDDVTVRLGDSTLPQAPVEGGSWTAASVSHAIVKTAGEVREELLRLAKTMPNSPLAGAKPDDVALVDGSIVDKARPEPRRVDRRRHARTAPRSHRAGKHRRTSRMTVRMRSNTHSAVFAEVKVDEELGVIRVTRVVSAVAAGRILNPEDRAQPDHGRRGVGHRHGAARGDAASTTTSAAS